METIGKRFNVGDTVQLDGVKGRLGTVMGYYSTAMVEVRVMDGCYRVGDVCTDEQSLELVQAVTV